MSDHDSIEESFTRPQPVLTPRTESFWTAGGDGVLRLAQCDGCGYYLHPPRPVCAMCAGRDIAFEPVSGRGTVWAWTLNRYQWNPAMPPPYVVASVELVEQLDLRLLTNLVECEVDEIRVGMPVQVCFARTGAVHVPLFRPAVDDDQR